MERKNEHLSTEIRPTRNHPQEGGEIPGRKAWLLGRKRMEFEVALGVLVFIVGFAIGWLMRVVEERGND